MITNQYELGTRQSSPSSIVNEDLRNKIKALREFTAQRKRIYSVDELCAAGFKYTGVGDTGVCNDCGLEVSNWTRDIEPFLVHEERQPTCSFVCSQTRPEVSSAQSTTEMETDNNSRIPFNEEKAPLHTFNELQSLKESRERSFSHWPHQTSPSSAEMAAAGFFNCNVGDRVICLYCKIICQQWSPSSDDPREVHKALSPTCPYVRTYLNSYPMESIPIVNEGSRSVDTIKDSTGFCDQLVSAEVSHLAYREIPKRYASFNTWSNESSPSVDDLVRAGFFYTGTRSIVTCFYCNGSLQNWAPTDNPMIEHARWFPLCAYAKQLCGDKEYRRIQQANQRRKEHQEVSKQNKDSQSSVGRLVIHDESTLSRYVAARLDLTVSQNLLKRNFKSSIVKRCWEDQLRLKGDDFHSDVDLLLACTVLQLQIQYIDGKKENILVPRIAMNKLREKELAASKPAVVSLPNKTDIEMSAATGGETTKTDAPVNIPEKKSDNVKNSALPNEDTSSPSNPCALCLTEEKCLAFVPCGHVAACVSCGHSVRTCPICRSEIKAFVRVYL